MTGGSDIPAGRRDERPVFGGRKGRIPRDNLSEGARWIARLDAAALGQLASRLPALMERRGFSRNELARRSLVPVNTIRGAVEGTHKPSVGKLIALAAALGTSLDALFGDEIPEAFIEAVRDH